MATDVSRRDFAGLAIGAAAVAAAPAAAQRGMGMGMGSAPLGSLTAGDWFAQVRAQHMAIDRQFQIVKRRSGMPGRMSALMELKTLLTAHSVAEEAALYPGVVLTVDRGRGERLYREQQEAKVMLAEIDNMLAMAPRLDDGEFMGRVTALETAIKAHVAEEERDAYPRLQRSAPAGMNAKMTRDFAMAFTRYYNGWTWNGRAGHRLKPDGPARPRRNLCRVQTGGEHDPCGNREIPRQRPVQESGLEGERR